MSYCCHRGFYFADGYKCAVCLKDAKMLYCKTHTRYYEEKCDICEKSQHIYPQRCKNCNAYITGAKEAQVHLDMFHPGPFIDPDPPTMKIIPNATTCAHSVPIAERCYVCTPLVTQPTPVFVGHNTVTKTEANKNDSTKLDFTLVPIEAMEGLTRALTYGIAKYGRNNYRNSGMFHLRLAAACLRHLFAWIYGESIDSESGLSHIDHAQASLAMLAFQMKAHPEMDNRK